MSKSYTATIIFLLLLAPSVFAQNQTEPYTLSSNQTRVWVWTSGSITYAEVRATFNDPNYALDWGQVTKSNNSFSVDIPVTHILGATLGVVTEFPHIYQIGTLASGAYTFAVTSRGSAVQSLQFDRDQSFEHWQPVTLTKDRSAVGITSAGGTSFAFVNLNFAEQVFRIPDWGSIARSGTSFYVDVKPEIWTGPPTQFNGAVHVYSLGDTPPGMYSITLYSRGVLVSTVNFNPLNQTVPWYSSAIDHFYFFVRQHYLDFLNREPDSDGLTFWGYPPCSWIFPDTYVDVACQVRRANVSAAFFLSIEFQETGYLVYRIYKASYGNLPGVFVPIKFNEFLPDTQKIQAGVVVNQANWQQQLEANKQGFLSEFVQRSRFVSAYPTSMTPAQFVEALFANAGVVPSATERQAAIDEFAGAPTSADHAARARALRRAAENQALTQQEFNRAFVLMQYFGYLRRDPNSGPDANFDGYNFWLNKLNQFNGDYSKAEMVKAFISSGEYRQRFGP